MRTLTLLLVMLCGAQSIAARTGWRLEAAHSDWGVRHLPNAIEFDGKLWVFHGSAGVAGPQRDAWSTTDGIDWIEEVSVLPWSSRSGAAMVNFDNRLWMLGGDASKFKNDVWSSPDGVNWTLEVANAPWLGRMYHAVVVYNNRIWLMGGYTLQPPFYNTLNDVWSSADGVNWTQEVAAANWSIRGGHSVVVFNNKMWLIGGWNQGITPNKNEVWSSTDGINWTLEVTSAPWTGRAGHTSAVYHGRIWIVGGYHEDAVEDVWSSHDGVSWVRETADAPFGARGDHAMAVFKDRIWVLAGAVDAIMNDVWSYGFHIVRTTLPGGLVNVPYTGSLQTKEGAGGPYTWSLTGGAPPPGLMLGTSTNEGLPVTGTPTALGTYTFTVKVTDSTGNFDEQVVTLTITRITQAGADTSPGCAAAPTGLPAAPLAAMALYALTRRRRRKPTACKTRGGP